MCTCMCACLCVCVCVCLQRFSHQGGSDLTHSPPLLSVIFLSISLCPFMVNYPEFSLLFSLLKCPLFLVSLGVYFTVPVRGTDSVTRKKKKCSFKSLHLNRFTQTLAHNSTRSWEPINTRATPVKTGASDCKAASNYLQLQFSVHRACL